MVLTTARATSGKNARVTGGSGKAGVITATAACRADLAGGTLDLWPLYLFHPGAVTVNFAFTIQTTCRMTSQEGSALHFKSLDTGREERFSSFDELMQAKSYKHPIGAWLVRAFRPQQGF